MGFGIPSRPNLCSKLIDLGFQKSRLRGLENISEVVFPDLIGVRVQGCFKKKGRSCHTFSFWLLLMPQKSLTP